MCLDTGMNTRTAHNRSDHHPDPDADDRSTCACGADAGNLGICATCLIRTRTELAAAAEQTN